ncbi:MAG TPA: DUF192 domain-containing protein [Candidatus Omnitrophota bacterium]|nr:DUF192 domain-containing protein [Candidatus Omnitrophota bacterium]
MRILNKTNNIVLAEDILVADNPFKRMSGLLGRREFLKGQALLIKPCNSVHTFFMRFPIDVLFIDKNNQVVKAIPCLKPFRLTYMYLAAGSCLELPCGAIQATSTREGDTLSLE